MIKLIELKVMAERSKVNIATIRRYIREGLVKAVRMGPKRKFVLAETEIKVITKLWGGKRFRPGRQPLAGWKV